MIYIEQLDLEDFQTHTQTRIELSPNFNVIVGCTRSGKTSVVRSLDFLFYNNWYEDYQRFDTPHTTITAKLSNGKILTRTKSDRINKISIKTGDVVERFESFGLTLPEEATAAMGIIPVDISDKDSIQANIANQDDPLFLLYSTGTDRTKILSRLSGLHWLDYALKDLNKDRREKSKEVQSLQEANEQLLSKLKNFKNLPALREDITVTKDQFNNLKEIAGLVSAGRLLITKTDQWKQSYQEFQKLKKIDFTTTISLLERAIVLQEYHSRLCDLHRRLQSNSDSLLNNSNHIKAVSTSLATVSDQITEEMNKVPTCNSCGQVLKQEVKT